MKFILRNDSIVPRDDAVTDIDDRGYQFGDGVYEVIRIYDRVPFQMKGHMSRLLRSAREIGMNLSGTEDHFGVRLTELVEKEAVATGMIYIQVTRGIYPRILLFPPKDLPLQITAYVREMARPLQEMENGVRVSLQPDIRWLRCDIKSLNLLPNMLARQKATEEDCAEALLHRGDIVTEGAFSNVFIISNGTVYTHPENNFILRGITRTRVISLCEQANIPVKEEAFTVKTLLAADEVVITSTTSEIMPVVRVADSKIGNGQPGPITRHLQNLFEQSLREN